jgi:hypothetical protein
MRRIAVTERFQGLNPRAEVTLGYRPRARENPNVRLHNLSFGTLMCRFQDIQQDPFEAVPGRGICTRSVAAV